MNLFQLSFLFAIISTNDLNQITDKRGGAENILACDASGIMQLQNRKLQGDFFKQLDSVLLVQYPDGRRESYIFVELTTVLLNNFLKDIDTLALAKTGMFEKEYHFKIAPKGYTDHGKCMDKISIRFSSADCSYIMTINNRFMVEDGWCTEHQVVYAFKIAEGKISKFWRNAAG
jgi:hypothetical protein